ncbi:hypothetical protein HYPSUDRAFT_41909 [Hypholoma sublateritium FD-334 SS-4]|uniref:Uncharacterized protein n=1 Tax=Hypholoma sublateritium (strain FD-334 SS-4) TaxID=945553 RepID=A0A0D2MDD0_HYPSF|nr:hypothetical protein HYPSUDRAFT_41909 [Hypholoma sublateritium FD-334 SS-4]
MQRLASAYCLYAPPRHLSHPIAVYICSSRQTTTVYHTIAVIAVITTAPNFALPLLSRPCFMTAIGR